MSRATLGAIAGATLAATVLVVARAAADITISKTWTTAGATVDEMIFKTLPDGGMTATVCGHTTLQGGGDSPGNCAPPVELPNGQFKTDMVGVRTNRALPHWKANNPDAPGL